MIHRSPLSALLGILAACVPPDDPTGAGGVLDGGEEERSQTRGPGQSNTSDTGGGAPGGGVDRAAVPPAAEGGPGTGVSIEPGLGATAPSTSLDPQPSASGGFGVPEHRADLPGPLVVDDYLTLNEAELTPLYRSPLALSIKDGMFLNADGTITVWEAASFERYTASFELLWSKEYDLPTNCYIRDVAPDASGNIYFVGNTFSSSVGGVLQPGLSGQPAFGSADAFVGKLDASGAEVWVRQFGSSGAEQASDVAVGPDGSIYVTGNAGSQLPGQGTQVAGEDFVAKFTPDGDRLWAQQIGFTARLSFKIQDTAVGEDGFVYLAAPEGIAQLDADGSVIWHTTRSELSVPLDLDRSRTHVTLFHLDGAQNLLGSALTDISSLDIPLFFTRIFPAAGGGVYSLDPGSVAAFNREGGLDWYRRHLPITETIDPVEGVLWTRSPRYVTAMKTTADAFYVGGQYQHAFANGSLARPTRIPGFVGKYDREGNQLWTQQFEVIPSEYPNNRTGMDIVGIDVEAAGSLVVLGNAGNTVGSSGYLLRLSASGELLAP